VQSETADVVVFKCRAPLPAPDRSVDVLTDAARSQKLPAAAVTVNLSLDGAELYAYLWLREGTRVEREPLAQALAVATNVAEVEAARYVRLQDIRGASHGATPEFHYVVETDVVPEAEGDLNEWYNQEHLPGLAAVPGAIRAQRLRNLDGAPRYHSCYELVAKETLGSAPWLAVRHTAWSDRVRPNFRNTKRTMFRRVAQRTL
jgi:hypothetical protein